MNLTPTQQKATSINFEIEALPLTGNVVPNEWYQHIKFANGKAHLLAITILSEIVWWYRPYEVRDPATGLSKHFRKFSADKFQMSYQGFADKFGVTKRQAKDACKFLQSQGLITLEFRHIGTKSGATLANVLFIEPIPLAISAISTPDEVSRSRGVSHSNVGGVTLERQTVSHSNVGGVTLERQTYTDIPSKKSTTKNTHTEKEIRVCAIASNFEDEEGRSDHPIETNPELTEKVSAEDSEHPKGYTPPIDDSQVPYASQEAAKQPIKPQKREEGQTVELSAAAAGFCEYWELAEPALRKALSRFDPSEWDERMAWAHDQLSKKSALRDKPAAAIAALRDGWGWPGIERARELLPSKMAPLADFEHEKPSIGSRRRLRPENPDKVLRGQIETELKRVFNSCYPAIYNGIPADAIAPPWRERFDVEGMHLSSLNRFMEAGQRYLDWLKERPDFSVDAISESEIANEFCYATVGGAL